MQAYDFAQVPQYIIAGADQVWTFGLGPVVGSLDLTGYTAVCQVRKRIARFDDPEPIVEVSTTEGGVDPLDTQGTIIIRFTEAQTAAMEAALDTGHSTLVYGIELRTPEGAVDADYGVLWGPVYIRPQVVV